MLRVHTLSDIFFMNKISRSCVRDLVTQTSRVTQNALILPVVPPLYLRVWSIFSNKRPLRRSAFGSVCGNRKSSQDMFHSILVRPPMAREALQATSSLNGSCQQGFLLSLLWHKFTMWERYCYCLVTVVPLSVWWKKKVHQQLRGVFRPKRSSRCDVAVSRDSAGQQ